jgi:hypothetical protein
MNNIQESKISKIDWLQLSKNIIILFSARNHGLLTFLLPKAPKGTKNALSARFNIRPVAGSMAKRAGLAFQDQTYIPFLTPFSPDGYPDIKPMAPLTHDKNKIYRSLFHS